MVFSGFDAKLNSKLRIYQIYQIQNQLSIKQIVQIRCSSYTQAVI